MHLNLTWPNFSDHVKDVFQDVMTSADFTDVTIVCDDQEQFRAHKLVLSACSPVFKRIISCLSTKDAVIYMKGVMHKEMKSILEFIYLGQSTFYEDRLEDFLKVARELDIKEISENRKSPSTVVRNNTQVENSHEFKGETIEDSQTLEEIVSTTQNQLKENVQDSTCNDSDKGRRKETKVTLNENSGSFDDPSQISFKFLQNGRWSGKGKNICSNTNGVLVTHDGYFKWHNNLVNRNGSRIRYECADHKRSGCTAKAIIAVQTINTEEGDVQQYRLESISNFEVTLLVLSFL